MQEEYLRMSEVYLAEETGNVCGFIALVENKIAAIFVSPKHQRKGIGKRLISFAKKIKTQLELNVYQDNKNSVKFYELNDFKILKETVDDEIKAKEFVMFWKK